VGIAVGVVGLLVFTIAYDVRHPGLDRGTATVLGMGMSVAGMSVPMAVAFVVTARKRRKAGRKYGPGRDLVVIQTLMCVGAGAAVVVAISMLTMVPGWWIGGLLGIVLLAVVAGRLYRKLDRPEKKAP